MERVLIIEDDPEIAFFERTILERAGYEVKVATTGAAGLEAEPGPLHRLAAPKPSRCSTAIPEGSWECAGAYT